MRIAFAMALSNFIKTPRAEIKLRINGAVLRIIPKGIFVGG